MEFLDGNIFGFVLILTRISAFFAAAPLFSWQALPMSVKLITVLLLSFFFSFLTPYAAPADPAFLETVVLLGGELFYGLAMGLVAYAFFTVVRIAGQIIEQQMGLTMANIIDPFTDEQSDIMGVLLEMLLVLLLLTTESHHLLLHVLSRSFELFAPGTVPTIAALTQSVLAATAAMLMLALQMAAPILAAFLLLMVVLGFMARVAPETNIMFLSMPIRIAMGLIMVGIFMPFIADYIKTFVHWVNTQMPA